MLELVGLLWDLRDPWGARIVIMHTQRDAIVELYSEKKYFFQLLGIKFFKFCLSFVLSAHYSSMSALHFPDTVNCQTCQNVTALWQLLWHLYFCNFDWSSLVSVRYCGVFCWAMALSKRNCKQKIKSFTRTRMCPDLAELWEGLQTPPDFLNAPHSLTLAVAEQYHRSSCRPHAQS